MNSTTTAEFTVNPNQYIGACYRFWHVANWNKPHRLLEPSRVERFRGGAPFADALNVVYLLGGRTPQHNCWFQGVDAEGRVRADFSGMIDQLSAAIAYGYTPWIVLDNVPYAMSDPPTEDMYGNTAPPADERVWHQYVRAAVKAMVKAFGREVVSQWWFRVGTEPDLDPGHWSGTKQQYFDHYDYTADAVASVLPDPLIGPGNILNPVEGEYGIVVRDQWGLDIIDHCATGRNACTGGVGAPIRWFSCSWYGRVGVPLAMFDQAITMIRRRLAAHRDLMCLPVKIGEFAVLHDETGTRLYSGETTEWGASFYAGIADRVYYLGIGDVYEWHHATEGVLHPKGQVIAMLDRMAGSDLLAVDPPQGPETDCGVIASRDRDVLRLLVYNHGTHREPKEPRTVRIAVRNPEPVGARWDLKETTVDADHGVWAYAFAADCEGAGVKPLPGAGRFEGGIEKLYGPAGLEVWQTNRDTYAALAVPGDTADARLTPADGGFTLTVPMPGHSVRLLELTPAGA